MPYISFKVFLDKKHSKPPPPGKYQQQELFKFHQTFIFLSSLFQNVELDVFPSPAEREGGGWYCGKQCVKVLLVNISVIFLYYTLWLTATYLSKWDFYLKIVISQKHFIKNIHAMVNFKHSWHSEMLWSHIRRCFSSSNCKSICNQKSIKKICHFKL